MSFEIGVEEPPEQTGDFASYPENNEKKILSGETLESCQGISNVLSLCHPNLGPTDDGDARDDAQIIELSKYQ